MSTSKAVLTQKFIAVNPHMGETEKDQVNNPMMYLRVLQKEPKFKSKASREWIGSFKEYTK